MTHALANPLVYGMQMGLAIPLALGIVLLLGWAAEWGEPRRSREARGGVPSHDPSRR